MITVNDILQYLQGFAPVETAMDFDNCGLLIGDKSAPVTNVLLTLDITPDAVEEAQKLGCELIVSHHPVIFRPLKRLNAQSAPYLLAKHGIAAVCMHTNLDLSEEFGVNTCLAAAAGIKNLRRSQLGECLFVGELENELTSDEFARRVMTALDCNGLRYTPGKGSVRTAAVSSGSGGSEIFAAAEEGADALITGEIKHHEINAANELGVCVVDAGHFKSEDVVILPLLNKLSARFPEIKFTKSQTYCDKMKYLSR